MGFYQLDRGFFCEIYYNGEANEIRRTRRFTSSACLEDYACYIKLDDLNITKP